MVGRPIGYVVEIHAGHYSAAGFIVAHHRYLKSYYVTISQKSRNKVSSEVVYIKAYSKSALPCLISLARILVFFHILRTFLTVSPLKSYSVNFFTISITKSTSAFKCSLIVVDLIFSTNSLIKSSALLMSDYVTLNLNSAQTVGSFARSSALKA